MKLRWIVRSIFALIFVLGVFLGTTSCGVNPPFITSTTLVDRVNVPTPPTTSPTTPTTAAVTSVTKVETSIASVATRISDDANVIKGATTQPVIVQHADSILNQVPILNADSAELLNTRALLDQALNAIKVQQNYSDGLLKSIASQNSNITTLSKQISLDETQLTKAYNDINDLKSKDHILLNVLLSGVIVLSILGIGLSVYSAISASNTKFALALGAASAVIGTIAVSLIALWTTYAWIGLGLVVVVLGLVIWQVIVLIRGLHTQVTTATTANTQIVKSIQAAKIANSASDSTSFEDLFSQLANVIQSTKTQAVVTSVKASTGVINNNISASSSSTSAVIT